MNPVRFFLTSLLLFIAGYSCAQRDSSSDSSVLGVFVASTPCREGTKPLKEIPLDADCELIKWNLVLYQKSFGKTPATFKLHCLYGKSKQGTRGFTQGAKDVRLEGTWTIARGTATNKHWIVYRLTVQKTNSTISFLKVNDNLLHLLDSSGRLMIGSAAWSYTMNRLER
jgi:hypothetical protein